MNHGVITLGETLIDFIPTDETNSTYHKSPGGAPANVAVGVARLGGNSSFLGMVGDDVLGRFLQETLQFYHVNTEQLLFSKDHRTGIVFVTNRENGERSFDFYINPSADRFLEENHINREHLLRHRILHFGSISLISEPAEGATRAAVKLAKENGLLISYDPNLRLMLWDSKEEAKDRIISMLGEVDILKISEEELAFITDKKSVKEGLEMLEPYEIPVIFVTLGAEGCYVKTMEGNRHVPAMKVKAIDTTGAGDAFVSGVLYSVDQYASDLHALTLEEASRIAEFASVSGGLAASTKGAMTALPTKAEVESYLDR
ncbi:aminoimidazole riboside kinase [Virgibacillus halodenitrificans]|uniref:aminoimidazole riboside kinase n=1 Tax=Virgibacillus halodenitrificans TaxID=1482 RepID=UPI001EFF2B90|nr:aminoimidazole riboside kinase [Virgibacillus halodenitrificans]